MAAALAAGVCHHGKRKQGGGELDETPRPSDHRGSEVMTTEECDRLLAETPIGRVAFLSDGDPHILPVNYRYHQNTIVIRTTAGSKMEAAEMRSRFAFEIDGWDERSRTGWSVLAHGWGETVEDADEIAELRQLGLEPWADGEGTDLWIRIRLDDITGRRVS